MIKVGLSGSRWSGKSTVCELFTKIGIPVFQADTILRYVIHNDASVYRYLKANAFHLFDEHLNIDTSLIKTKRDFDLVVNCSEFDLFAAFDQFCRKNSDSIYIIFHSNILFERSWNKRMTYNINVFSAKINRIERGKSILNKTIGEVHNILKGEIDGYDKSRVSNFVIQNSNDPDLLESVNRIDKIIVDKYIEKMNKKIDNSKKLIEY